MDFFLSRYYHYKYFQTKYKENFYFDDKCKLKGGGVKEFTIKIDNITEDFNKNIVFHKVYDDGQKKVVLTKLPFNEDNLINDSCIVILLDKNIAYLDKIEVDKFECIDLVDFTLKKSGYFHLKATIKMLKKYKEKLGINRIVLRDNATVKCKFKKKLFDYNLSQFLLLTKSYTWYGKHGFKINKDERKEYLETLKVIETIKIKDIDFNSIFKEIEGNDKFKYIDKSLYDNIKKSFLNNKDIKLQELLHFYFYENRTEESCKIYAIFSKPLIAELRTIKQFTPLKPTTYYLNL